MSHNLTKNFNFIHDYKLAHMLEKLESYFFKSNYIQIPIIGKQVIQYVFLKELGYSKEESFVECISHYKKNCEDSLMINGFYQIEKLSNLVTNTNGKKDVTKILNFTNTLYLVGSIFIFLQNIFRNKFKKNFSAIPYLKREIYNVNNSNQRLIPLDELHIQKESVVNLLRQKHLVLKIPFYQRRYTWNESQLKTLLEDIQSRNDDDSSHYFGVITIKKELLKNDKNIHIKIIDGQQRLTTSILFLKAAYNNIEKRGLKRISFLNEIFEDKQLHKRYLNESATDDEKKELEQILTMIYPKTFEWNYGRNYKKFYDFFNSQNNEEEMHNLIFTFVKKFKVAELEYNVSSSKEMDIFENMNSKGTELKEWDLIKNHIFNSIPNHVQISDKDKVKIMKEEFELEFRSGIHFKKQEKELSNFFQEFLYLKFARQNKKFMHFDRFPIYNNFKKYFNEESKKIKSLEQYKIFLNELRSIGVIYTSLHRKDVNILSASLRSICTRWKNISCKQQIYFLIFEVIAMFGKWNGKQWSFSETKNIFDIVKLLDSILVRLELVKGFGYSLKTNCFDLFTKIQHNSCKSKIIQFVNKSELFSITNEEFYSSLLKTKIKTSILQRIFSELENFIVDPKAYGLNFDIQKPSLEHVMPQNNNQWHNYLSNFSDRWEDDYKSTLNMIGNFYILPKKLNSAISNKKFQVKKIQLLEISSPLIIGNMHFDLIPLKDIHEWSFDFIRERSRKIAKVLVNYVYNI